MTIPEHAHCGYCGHAFADAHFPNTCKKCGKTTYLNPTLVGVMLVPVDNGILIIRRKDFDKLAFPGGFIERGETWQTGATRELWEEASIKINPDDVSLFDAISTPDGRIVLVFGLAPRMNSKDFPDFVENEEVSERLIVKEPVDLVFPIHTEVLKRYFEQIKSPTS